jgi:hypothetical protein
LADGDGYTQYRLGLALGEKGDKDGAQKALKRAAELFKQQGDRGQVQAVESALAKLN